MTPAGKPPISLFIPSLAGGGVEMNMVRLARAFADEGHPVDLVLADARGPLRGAVDPRVRVSDLGKSRVLFALPGLVRHLRNRRPAVLLAGMMHANIVALAAARIAGTGCRVVVSEHAVLSLEWEGEGGHPGRIYPWLARRLYPRAHAVIAVSDDVADDLAALTGLDREGVTVIGNPVPVDRILGRTGPLPAHPFFEPGTPPVVIAVGRLHRQKSFGDLLEAHAILRADVDHRLLILGEGPQREELRARAERLGVAGSVDFPGFVDDPGGYLLQADAFALPSRAEGFGNVLVEALAAGLPVVSTRCPGGPVTILENGRHGRLVPVGDPAAMAAGLAAALRDPGPAPPRRDRAADFAVPRVAARYLRASGLAPESSAPGSH